jgi:hypothetical protein
MTLILPLSKASQATAENEVRTFFQRFAEQVEIQSFTATRQQWPQRLQALVLAARGASIFILDAHLHVPLVEVLRLHAYLQDATQSGMVIGDRFGNHKIPGLGVQTNSVFKLGEAASDLSRRVQQLWPEESVPDPLSPFLGFRQSARDLWARPPTTRFLLSQEMALRAGRGQWQALTVHSALSDEFSFFDFMRGLSEIRRLKKSHPPDRAAAPLGT